METVDEHVWMRDPSLSFSLLSYPATKDSNNAITFRSPSADPTSRPLGVNICVMDTSVPKIKLNPIKIPPSTK